MIGKLGGIRPARSPVAPPAREGGLSARRPGRRVAGGGRRLVAAKTTATARDIRCGFQGGCHRGTSSRVASFVVAASMTTGRLAVLYQFLSQGYRGWCPGFQRQRRSEHAESGGADGYGDRNPAMASAQGGGD